MICWNGERTYAACTRVSSRPTSVRGNVSGFFAFARTHRVQKNALYLSDESARRVDIHVLGTAVIGKFKLPRSHHVLSHDHAEVAPDTSNVQSSAGGACRCEPRSRGYVIVTGKPFPILTRRLGWCAKTQLVLVAAPRHASP